MTSPLGAAQTARHAIEAVAAGEFGAADRLSPKALRLYAEQGVLPPAQVDPATGYRYYAQAQLRGRG